MEKIGVLDFGGQYAHLIANRVRRLGVFSEIVSPLSTLQDLTDYKGLIFSGGPASVYADNAPDFNPESMAYTRPMLGICYGHQMICQALGGKVQPGEVREYGLARIQLTGESPLFKDLQKRS